MPYLFLDLRAQVASGGCAHLPNGCSIGEVVETIGFQQSLETEIEHAYDAIEEDELRVGEADFDIGFEGLNPNLQLLQLSILDVIESEGDQASLSKLAEVLPQDSDEVRQRTLRMDHIGHVDLNKEEEIVILQDKGRELLEQEYPEN